MQLLKGVLFLILLIKASAWIHECSAQHNINGCDCHDTESKVDVLCQDANLEDFKRIRTQFYHYEIDRFVFQNVTLGDIDKYWFENISIRHLIISASEIKTFHLFQSFRGIRNLTSIMLSRNRVHNYNYSSGEDLIQLKRLSLYLDEKNGEQLAKSLSKYLPENVTSITLGHLGLLTEHIFSFRRFKNLEVLELLCNKLTTVKREYLSRPALHLTNYSLNGNPITQLPLDTFEDMPALRYIELKYTRLTSLPYDVFKPILNHLVMLDINSIKLKCDCHNSWLLTEMSLWEKSYVRCSEPYSLYEKNLKTLTPMDMCLAEEYNEHYVMEYCKREAVN